MHPNFQDHPPERVLTLTVLIFWTSLFGGCGGSLSWRPACIKINPGITSFWNADMIIGPITFDKIQAFSGNNGIMSTGITPGTSDVGKSYVFNNINDQIQIPAATNISSVSALTVSAWVKSRTGNNATPTIQTILSNTGLQPSMADPTLWSGVNLQEQLGSTVYSGYRGGIFDGRYVYFSPFGPNIPPSGNVTRYDTQGDYDSATSWSSIDISDLDGSGSNNFRGFFGGTFDGRYVYFSPTYYLSNAKSFLPRYDTQLPFTSLSSWEGVQIAGAGGKATTFGNTYLGTAFDGRYVYLLPNHVQTAGVPYILLQFDTQGSLSSPGSWKTFDTTGFVTTSVTHPSYSGATFDGRYLYLAPYGGAFGELGTVLRYDTSLEFEEALSWTQFDLLSINPSGKGFSSALFDGRYVYFIPLVNDISGVPVFDGLVFRYDIQKSFTEVTSWTTFDTATLNTRYLGFHGGTFDGRYLYLAPGHNPSAGKFVVRYDTLADFQTKASWEGLDITSTSGLGDSNYGGFMGAIFDGRSVYFIPSASSYIPRFDTSGELGGYSFKLSDWKSDGYGMALSGVTFTAASDSNVLNLSSFSGLEGFEANSWHHVAATYDGSDIKLYLDGTLSTQTSATGPINTSTANFVLGSTPSGNRSLPGELSQVQIYSEALSATDIQNIYNTSSIGYCN